MSDHKKVFVAAYAILQRDNKIFLLRRANTGYQDGNYGLPAGHVEEGEHPSRAAIREAKEEIGVLIKPEHVHLAHVMHRLNDGGGREYDDFFFTVSEWEGEPQNGEPEKCDECGWFDLNSLPNNMISYIRAALVSIREKQLYSEL